MTGQVKLQDTLHAPWITLNWQKSHNVTSWERHFVPSALPRCQLSGCNRLGSAQNPVVKTTHALRCGKQRPPVLLTVSRVKPEKNLCQEATLSSLCAQQWRAEAPLLCRSFPWSGGFGSRRSPLGEIIKNMSFWVTTAKVWFWMQQQRGNVPRTWQGTGE